MKIALAELVLDFEIYPRHDVDALHVRRLVDSLQAGGDFPRIVADEKTKRVVDGFHRYRAYQQVLEATAEVEVELRAYEDEHALILDAAARNHRHGLPLRSMDRAHLVLKAQRLGISMERLAEALMVPRTRLEEITRGKIGEVSKGVPVILKPAMRHMAGRRLTKAQAAVNDRLTGMRADYYLRTVIEMLRAGAFDTGSETIEGLLKELRGLL